VGEPGDGFQAEAPREVIPFNPRANEVLATRNGFVRGGNTGIPCAVGTCSYEAQNTQFEAG
jgi:hypothetical protein